MAAARKRLREVPGVDVLDGPGVDPAKLVVLLAGTGAHGSLVEADLIAAGMPVEMGDRDTVVPIVTMADDEEQIAAFTEELIDAIERHRGQPRRPAATAAWTVRPQTVLAPREAFFAPNETVAASAAVGRISAELVAPYPPGVPVLAPGELITAEALAALREVAADGGRIAYAEDPSLAYLPGHRHLTWQHLTRQRRLGRRAPRARTCRPAAATPRPRPGRPRSRSRTRCPGRAGMAPRSATGRTCGR